jgi:dTDP-4-amino-4,6-dideoxygalactose transaminase
MEFRDLKKQYARLKDELDAAMQRVAFEGHYIMGPEVKALEEEMAAWVGVKHCLTCANGTDALTLALKAWGVGPGDAVFVPDFTFFSSAEVVPLEGATPVFVDVEEDTFNIDVEDLERAVQCVLDEGRLTPRVVVGVDLFGRPADWKALRAVADRYGLLLLEDGAQGFGGSIAGQRVCSFADIATTSFFPAKPLGCYGDGGAVFTDNDEWAALIDSYRVHGKGTFKYDNVRIGMNSRLDTFQAAILQVKFRAFRETELDAVNDVAATYHRLLADVPGLVLPLVSSTTDYFSSWAQYTIRILAGSDARYALQAHLKSQGIPSMIYYPTPMHGQTAFANLMVPSGRENKVWTSSRLCDEVLSLPLHPYMSEEDIVHVCNAIRLWQNERANKSPLAE